MAGTGTADPFVHETRFGSFLERLNILWEDVGESKNDREQILRMIEQDCVFAYEKRIDEATSSRDSLLNTLDENERKLSRLRSDLGEKPFPEITSGSIKERIEITAKAIDEHRQKKEEMMKHFNQIKSEISKVRREMDGTLEDGNNVGSSEMDSNDFSQEKLDSLRSQLKELQEKMENRRECIGYLNVTMLKGTDLVIRDIFSSDPYVSLTFCQQTLKTTIKNKNLNPVWNEVFKLRVPQHYGALKLEVFDRDMFSADDKMGEAEVDVNPIVMSATLASGDFIRGGNIQLGKWIKTDDNALTKDSTIHLIDGKIKQEISLKLQNVERGTLDLQLEWVPPEDS